MTLVNPNLLKRIIHDQQEEQLIPKHYYPRSCELKLADLSKNPEIIVLTGIRRCGKSVLMNHVRQKSKESDFYFNFEDERLVNFTVEDFQTLQEVLIELFGPQKTYYFDEIQNIEGWEMFVRRLYNAGNKIYITGSNANLFSEELGTRLTGRYISLSIYPLSFKEYAHYYEPIITQKKAFSTTETGKIKKLFNEYCQKGGIPEYVKHGQQEYLHALFNSILYRDIIARYKISNPDAIKKLVFYLATNCSKEITFSSAKKYLSIGSTTTVSDYCGYLENSYLCSFMNRYHDSIKAQQQSPKKVYFSDHVLAKIIGFRISEDYGRMLENMVFLELKRRQFDVYSHHDTKECDFIIRQGPKTLSAIQVCKSLADENTKKREFEGLLEAMTRFSLTEGFIITEHESFNETIDHQNKKVIIHVIPIWQWLQNA